MKKLNKKLVIILLFFSSALILNFYSWNPNIIEKYYSTTINKTIIEILSRIFQVFSFSLYEVTIISIVLFFITYFIITIVKVIKNKALYKKIICDFLLNSLVILSVGYFLYVFMWTLNYKRVPFDEKIGLKKEQYTVEELAELYKYLIDETNNLRVGTPVDKENNIATTLGDYNSVFERANKGYEIAGEKYKTLEGNYGKPTKLLFSEFFNYTGITGIYLPFTGQPGVNIKAPQMMIPVTTLHEMAHQRGYAREEEANFIAFLVCTLHTDIDFKYSGYALALSYAGNALYIEDTELYKKLSKDLSDEVKNDIQYRIDFWDGYSGKIEKVASKINDTYLKSNGVDDGEKSYGRMLDLLLEYYFQEIKEN